MEPAPKCERRMFFTCLAMVLQIILRPSSKPNVLIHIVAVSMNRLWPWRYAPGDCDKCCLVTPYETTLLYTARLAGDKNTFIPAWERCTELLFFHPNPMISQLGAHSRPREGPTKRAPVYKLCKSFLVKIAMEN